ncbi:hypothetical protein CC2G_009855 [Coprinopsis cinerea AmutBmut pab1-1]|nr:hypothetical protein CC2G_009855 [Coprinopsis cinerea AmutBmut pab1-1]
MKAPSSLGFRLGSLRAQRRATTAPDPGFSFADGSNPLNQCHVDAQSISSAWEFVKQELLQAITFFGFTASIRRRIQEHSIRGSRVTLGSFFGPILKSLEENVAGNSEPDGCWNIGDLRHGENPGTSLRAQPGSLHQAQVESISERDLDRLSLHIKRTSLWR